MECSKRGCLWDQLKYDRELNSGTWSEIGQMAGAGPAPCQKRRWDHGLDRTMTDLGMMRGGGPVPVLVGIGEGMMAGGSSLFLVRREGGTPELNRTRTDLWYVERSRNDGWRLVPVLLLLLLVWREGGTPGLLVEVLLQSSASLLLLSAQENAKPLLRK